MRFQMHIQEYAASSTNLVAVGSFDGAIRLGDVDTDAISEPLPDTHVNAVTALYVCDDNSTIVSGSGLLPWMAHGANALQFRFVLDSHRFIVNLDWLLVISVSFDGIYFLTIFASIGLHHP